MITNKKVKVYQKFSGDLDAFARAGSKAEMQIINDNDWILIDSFLQDIKLHSEGRLSNAYSEGLTARINAEVEDASVLEALKKMAL